VFCVLAITGCWTVLTTKQDVVAKCSNCGNNHTASYGGCTKIKEQKQIQKIKATNSISYRDAVAQFKAKSSVQSISSNYSVQTVRPTNNNLQQLSRPLVKQAKQTKEMATQTEILVDQSTNTLSIENEPCVSDVDRVVGGSEMRMATCLLEILSSIGKGDSLNKKCAAISKAFESYLGVKLDQKSILNEFKSPELSKNQEIHPSPVIKTSKNYSKEALKSQKIQNRKI